MSLADTVQYGPVHTWFRLTLLTTSLHDQGKTMSKMKKDNKKQAVCDLWPNLCRFFFLNSSVWMWLERENKDYLSSLPISHIKDRSANANLQGAYPPVSTRTLSASVLNWEKCASACNYLDRVLFAPARALVCFLLPTYPSWFPGEKIKACAF